MGGGLSETEQEDNSRKKKRRIIILILLLLLLLSIGSCAMWQFSQPKADPGVTVQAHKGKSDEEVIAELNRQAEESRMTISVSAKPKLEDGKVRVNVSNVAENKFSQTFTLSLRTASSCTAPGLSPLARLSNGAKRRMPMRDRQS